MPHELPNDLRLETREVQNNVKTLCNYNLVTSLPPKKKILLILAKDSLKIELNFSRSVLFHMETRVFLKYFVRGCSLVLRNLQDSSMLK